MNVLRRLTPLLVLPVLVVCGTAGSALAATGSGDGFRISEREGSVAVKLLDSSVAPKAVEKALRERGVKVQVLARPVSPSLEGTWLGAHSGDSGIQRIVDEADRTRAVLRKGADKLTLDLGRHAEDGEIYDVSRNAFCPGEILAGSGIADLAPADAEAALAVMGIHVSWRVSTTTSVDPDGGHAAGNTGVVSEPPAGVITSVVPSSSQRVFVFVSPPGDYASTQRSIPTTC